MAFAKVTTKDSVCYVSSSAIGLAENKLVAVLNAGLRHSALCRWIARRRSLVAERLVSSSEEGQQVFRIANIKELANTSKFIGDAKIGGM